MTNILLFLILMMMIIITVGAFLWWKNYGKKLFQLITGMGNTLPKELDFLKDFKIPNQWK